MNKIDIRESNWPIRIIWICAFFLAGFFIWHGYTYPSTMTPHADATAYMLYAQLFREHGFLYDIGTVRSWGYPGFIYFITFLTGIKSLSITLGVEIAQFLLFFVCTYFLTKQIRSEFPRLAWAILVGLLLNPIVLSLVGDFLTESLSLSLTLLLITCAILACKSQTTEAILGWLGFGAMVAGYLLMVRPANIAQLVAWHGVMGVALTFFVPWKNRYILIAGKRVPIIFGYSLLALSSLLLACGPQLYYNLVNLDKFSLMPLCKLGDMQIRFGAIIWKAIGLVNADGEAYAIFYINPYLQSALPEKHALLWYFQNPIAGILTLGVHIFYTFDVRHIFTYIREPAPIYSFPLTGLIWVLEILGFWNLVQQGWRSRLHYKKILDYPMAIPGLFTLISVALAVALNSIIAVEQRFGLLPQAFLIVTGLHWVFAIQHGSLREFFYTLTTASAFATLALLASYKLDAFTQKEFPRHLMGNPLENDHCTMRLKKD